MEVIQWKLKYGFRNRRRELIKEPAAMNGIKLEVLKLFI